MYIEHLPTMKAMLSKTEKIHPQTSRQNKGRDKRMEGIGKDMQNFFSVTIATNYTLEGTYQDLFLTIVIVAHANVHRTSTKHESNVE